MPKNDNSFEQFKLMHLMFLNSKNYISAKDRIQKI